MTFAVNCNGRRVEFDDESMIHPGDVVANVRLYINLEEVGVLLGWF
jgi:hypothetical protein